jgi:hypothetical protein
MEGSDAPRVVVRFRIALRDARTNGATSPAAGRVFTSDALAEESRPEDVRDDLDASEPGLATSGCRLLAASATSPSALDARAHRQVFLLTARLRF